MAKVKMDRSAKAEPAEKKTRSKSTTKQVPILDIPMDAKPSKAKKPAPKKTRVSKSVDAPVQVQDSYKSAPSMVTVTTVSRSLRLKTKTCSVN